MQAKDPSSYWNGQKDRVYSSDLSIDMGQEFVYQNYPYLRRENSPVYGVAEASEVVFHPVDLDELCYILMAEGTHMILFGGVWDETTQSIIDQINFQAREHGVDTIYLFDWSVDGTEEASIKRDLTEQEGYDGPDKRSENPFSVYNYYYGEIMTRYLSNADDWVSEERRAGHRNDITYLNRYEDAVSVANIKEPFLFLYNRTNGKDHSGKDVARDFYPIVWAAEFSACRDKEDGGLYSDSCRHDESTWISNMGAVLEEKIFSHVGEEDCEITPYTYADYMRSAFSLNERGHSYKTEPSFSEDEPIQVQKINFQVFYWMLQQKGSFVFMIAGPWCAYSQGGVATVNDYAVANGLRAYMTDIRMDSKHAIDFWYYPRRNELTMSCPPMRKYYIEVWEKYFARAEILCSLDPGRPWKNQLTVDYTDEEGKEHSVLSVGVPYILSYNKDHLSYRGWPAPILASRHDAGELINCSDEYIYHKPNYVAYRAAIYRVYYAYFESLGREDEMKDITVDRTKKKVEGKPVNHPETPFYTKEHDWHAERADRVKA